MAKTPLFALLAALASLLACALAPSDWLIWLTVGLFAVFGCFALWTLIRSFQK